MDRIAIELQNIAQLQQQLIQLNIAAVHIPFRMATDSLVEMALGRVHYAIYTLPAALGAVAIVVALLAHWSTLARRGHTAIG